MPTSSPSGFGASAAHPRAGFGYPWIVMAQTIEKEFMGGSKAKVWTYVILAGLLLIGLVVANFAWENPEDAKSAIDGFLGLPGWALVGIIAVVGILVFWGGLKIEADWPEALGALLISGAVLAVEMMVGLDTFAFFNMGFLPYIIPALVFVVLFGVGVLKSA